MNTRRIIALTVGAGFIGLIFGVALSGADLVSVQVWVGASAVTIVAVMIRDFVVAASIERAPISPAWRFAAVGNPPNNPRGLQNMRSLLSSAQTYPRSYDRNLRPHLIELAEHYLPRRHGLDLSKDSAQVRDLLGDTCWLVDPTPGDRTPTIADLQRFLDVVVGDEPQTLHPQSEGTAIA